MYYLIGLGFTTSLYWLWLLFCSFLYQIAHLGDDDDEPEFSSAMPLEDGDTFFFAPRPLKNLALVDEMESLSPVMTCYIADLGMLKLLLIAELYGREMMHFFHHHSKWRYTSVVCHVRKRTAVVAKGIASWSWSIRDGRIRASRQPECRVDR